MGHRQRGQYLRTALMAVCALASISAAPSWAQSAGGGDAGNTVGIPGTAGRQMQPRPERPQGEQRIRNRSGGTGDAGNTVGVPGTAGRPPQQQPRPQFDGPRGGGGRPDGGRPDRGFNRPPDRGFDRNPGRGPDRDGPRGWNGPGRDFSPGRNFAGPDRRPDFRPDPRPDYRPGYRPDYRPDYRPPPRFQGGPGYYNAPPPVYGYRAPPRRNNYYVYVDRRPFLVPEPRVRYYRDYPVVRPYGAWYQGYGRYRTDEDAFRWLGLTAITLGVLNQLDEGQQRTLEDAQIQATDVPVGTRLDWSDRGARGSVQVLSDGRDAAGRYCREFEQTVTVDGRTERASGTACQDEGGIWEVVAPS